MSGVLVSRVEQRFQVFAKLEQVLHKKSPVRDRLFMLCWDKDSSGKAILASKTGGLLSIGKGFERFASALLEDCD
jgi:hypothetical protein